MNNEKEFYTDAELVAFDDAKLERLFESGKLSSGELIAAKALRAGVCRDFQKVQSEELGGYLAERKAFYDQP